MGKDLGRKFTEQINMNRKVKVYDVANKHLLGTFESLTDAQKFTGVHTANIGRCIAHKYKSYTNKLGITIYFR